MKGMCSGGRVTVAIIVLLALGCGKGENRSTPEASPATKPAVVEPTIAGHNVPLIVQATVQKVSKIPEAQTMEYDDVLTTVKLTVDKVVKGKYAKKDLLMQLFAVRDRWPLPAAARMKQGDKVRLYLIPWEKAPEEIQSMQQVDDVGELNLPSYFAVALENLTPKPIDAVALAAQIQQSRVDENAKAIAGINAELEKYGGGSFEKWFENVKELRDDVSEQIELNKPENWGPRKANGLRMYAGMIRELTGTPPEQNVPATRLLELRKALEGKGIDFIFVSIPRPPYLYPDYYTDVALPHLAVAPRYRAAILRMLQEGMEVVDTLPRLLEIRKNDEGLLLIPAVTLHPTNLAMREIAKMVAPRVRRYQLDRDRYEVFVNKDAPPHHGTSLKQVVSAAGGPLYQNDIESPVLVVGDSTIRVNVPLASTGFPAHLARELGMKVAYFQNNNLKRGGFAKADPKLLEGKSVVVWVEWSTKLGIVNEQAAWNRAIPWPTTRVFSKAGPPKK